MPYMSICCEPTAGCPASATRPPWNRLWHAPRNKWAYGRTATLPALAAAYGYGQARNHPYRDGNKRIAFLAMAILLGLNGSEIDAPEEEVVALMLKLATGRLSEAALAKWIRLHLIPYTDS